MSIIRKSIVTGLLLGTVGVIPAANAGVSANAGFVTDYYFRGASLGDAGAYFGLDYENSGFYAGTWWIDDGGDTSGNDGLETDFYFGYGYESGDFSAGIGYNRYEYTYTSDYEDEIMLTLGYSMLSFEYAGGTDTDEEGLPATVETDFSHTALGLSGEILGIKYGSYENDDVPAADYTYIELSAGGTVGEFDLSVTVGDASQDDGDPGAYIFLDISKSFDLF